MVSSQARRDQVALAMERGHSQRQACELIELPRSILKYRSLRAERDVPALDAMRRIGATYPRYGYRRIRIFLRREGHAIDVAGSIRSRRVIEVLTRLISARDAPAFLRSDNGPEFISKAIPDWLAEAKIDTALIDPGKPWQNGSDESFNAKFRDECLSTEWFHSRSEARVLIEIWRCHNNDVRPHSSLDYCTPNESRRHHDSAHQGAIVK